LLVIDWLENKRHDNMALGFYIDLGGMDCSGTIISVQCPVCSSLLLYGKC